MKRILLFLIGILATVNMLADEYVDNYGIKYTYTPPAPGTTGEATLSDGKGLNTPTFTITASFTEGGVTYSVTSIADDAFANKVESSYNDNYTPVHAIIPEGITTIGKNAFRKCSNLKLLELPASLTSIGDKAFSDCSRIGHVYCGFESLKANLLSYIPSNDPMALYVPETYLNTYIAIDNLKTKFKGGIYGGNFKLVDYDEMSYVCATGSGKEATLYLGKDETDITVPHQITVEGTTYIVYNIGRGAFYKFSNLSNLIIEDGVTSIHSNAFSECPKLNKLDIRSSNITIASSAFNKCAKLLYVCSNLSNPTSSNSLNYLPSNDLMKLYIRDNSVWNQYKNNQDLINKFTGGIYHGGDLLEIYDENSGMTYVIANGSGDATLSIGKNEPVVTIPEKIVYNSSDYYVTTIAKEAFKDKNKIIDLTIEGDHFKGIGYNAFYNCSSLRNVVFPSTLSTISDNAFWGCKGLVHVVCKNSAPTAISEKAFMISNNTWSSATLYVPSNTTGLYQAATGWKNFVNIQEGDLVEVTQEGLTYACLKNGMSFTATVTKAASDVTRVTIPEFIVVNYEYCDVTSIAEKAFQNCKSLEKVVLPSSLTSIGDYAFDGCSNLVYVVCSRVNQIDINENVFSNYQAILFVPGGDTGHYRNALGWGNFAKILEGDMGECKIDNMNYVYATYSGVAILVKSETTEQDVTIPCSIEFNGDYYSVTDIDKSAFKGRTSLINLTIADGGVQGISTIGASAFQNCSNLQKVVLPSTLTKIDDYAFAGCNKIKEIISKVVAKTNSPFTFSDNVFSETIYPTATVYVPIGSKTAYEGKDGWKNFTNYLEGEKLKATVDKMTYEYLTGPKTATLISTTTTVKNVIIPDSVKIDGVKYGVIDIGQNAFKGNTSIERLTISEKVKTIGAYAFQGCTGLKKIELPSTLMDIGEKAFDGCKYITHICSNISANALFEINNNVFSVYTASLYVPEGTLETYKAKNGWNNFTNNTYTGYFVDDLTTDNLSYDCLITGSGNTAAKTATLTKSATSTADVVILDSVLVGGLYYRVTNIRPSTFSGNSKLVNITIPEYVTTIGENAFNNCNNIANIITKIKDPSPISDNVFSISSATLYVPVGTKDVYKNRDGWKKFQTVYEGEMKSETPDDMTYIYATGDKTAILVSTTTTAANVIIPDSFAVAGVYYKVTAIDKSVFKGKTSIVNLTLPATLTQIGDNAFNGCKNLATITCKATVPPVLGNDVFSVYTASLYVPEGTLDTYKATAGWNSFTKNTYTGCFVANLTKDYLSYDCLITGSGNTATKTATLIKSATPTADVVIPDSVAIGNDYYRVTNIRPSAFSGNSKLVNITIPEYVESIGESAFGNCNNIVNIISKIKTPFVINNDVFSISSATLYVPVGKRDVYKTTDGWSKFSTVYEGLMIEKPVGEMVYQCATGDKTAIMISTTTTATDVIVPDSFAIDNDFYKVIAINQSVFKGKTSIVNLTLPATLTQIGDNTFNGCKNITTITCKAKEPPVITENVFPAYTAILYVPVGSRAKYQQATGWNNFATVLEGEWKEVTLDGGMTFVYATGDKTATLTKTTSTAKDVTIRGSFDIDGVTYKVTAIGNSAFKGNTSVVNLKISENIKSIGAYAFQSCSNLKRVELPSTLTDIGDKAFDGCKNLTHVCSKSKTPTDIPENAFSAYTAKLFVPDGTPGKYQARSGWNKFTNVYQGYFVDEMVDEGMTFVCLINGEGEKATKNATLIKSATSTAFVLVPASVTTGDVSYSVTTIGQSAFINNSKLATLTLSENIKTIEDNAFANCLNLSVIISMIKVPSDFNDNVFSAYTATLYVPESTRSDYQKAKGWKNFATILEGERNETTTEDGMTYIYATGDKTATLVKASKVDKDVTVPGTFKVGEVTYTVTAIDNSVFKDKKTIVNLKIEENIKSIGANAFENCVNLEKVELPSTVTEIGENAFANCTRLSHIVCRVKSTFPINNNVFAESIYPTAKLYVPTVTSADYKTTAGWENFKNILVGDMKEVTQEDITYYLVQGQNIATLVKASTSAAEVTIPATVKDGEATYHVTDIGAYAFSGIGSLKKLTISEGVKSVGIGAFQNCSNLDKIVLPASLTAIGEFAFDKCNRLTLVRNDASAPIGISENVFSVYTGKLNVPIGSGSQYRNADGWKLFSTILEGDMLEAEVDGMTYAYVTGPRTATLMKGVTEANDLTIPSTVTIGGVEYTVTAIEESAFVNASSIVNLTISGGIKTIGANAFKNCSYLTKVELPASLEAIGSGAFSKCDRLSHVVSFIKVPFPISDDVFTTLAYNNGTLYVPVNTSDLYKGTAGWNNFLSVLEGDIDETTVDGMTYICVPNLKIAKLTKGVSGVKDVTIPASISIDGTSYEVTDIDRSAFYGINSLENLIISEGVKTIGYTAFKNCYNLKTVSLPSSLTSIGEYAFENCKKIASINCYGKKPIAISENVFSSTANLYVPVGTASLYQADNCWGKFTIMEATPIIIGKSGKASYCGDNSLDFNYSDEVKAYIATGYDETEGTIWLTRVKDVPAGVPVLIKGTAEKTYNVPITTSQNSYYKNMFKGNTSGDAIQVKEIEGDKVNYYLSGDGTFKSVKNYVNLGNNKCYLQLPSSFKPAETGAAQTVVIKSSGKASFAAPVDLDFTNVKGLKAFTATGYDKSTKTIWLTRVMKVQKGEGVLLKGNANDYEIPSVAVQSSYMNMFIGNTSGAQIQVKETSADGSQTNFYLNSNGSFVSVNGFVNIGNNKCYLELPTSMVAVASTRGSEADYKFEEPEIIKLPISFRSIDNDGNGTTVIHETKQHREDNAYYTLQGQRVENPGKGIYIKNGKKVIIK